MLLESSTVESIDQQLIECKEWDGIVEVLKHHLLKKERAMEAAKTIEPGENEEPQLTHPTF